VPSLHLFLVISLDLPEDFSQFQTLHAQTPVVQTRLVVSTPALRIVVVIQGALVIVLLDARKVAMIAAIHASLHHLATPMVIQRNAIMIAMLVATGAVILALRAAPRTATRLVMTRAISPVLTAAVMTTPIA
jgi:hypothetical protein